MRAEVYIRELHTETINDKGLEVLLKIQGIFSEWARNVGAVLSISGIVAMCSFFYSLDAVACAYEGVFPPPAPQNGHAMQIYRIVQHILSLAAFSLLTWCIHTLFHYFFLIPKKEGYQKEIEALLNANPGFLSAIKRVDLNLHEEIVGFLPDCNEHFAT